MRATRVEGGDLRRRDDWVAVEEPLEIRLRSATGQLRRVAVTMRTPGADFELAVGFLFAEGLLRDRRAVAAVRYCDEVEREDQRYNVVTVHLRAPTLPDLSDLERFGTISSACGVCGKTTLEAVTARDLACRVTPVELDVGMLRSLPGRLRAAQDVFDRTGGLHAAALFTTDGELVVAREDVGRHNAMDKVLGWALLGDQLSAMRTGVALVSGRASYELVQKALAAGVPCLAAISAPSSLAVDLAAAHGMTLIGFLRDDRCNVYAGAAPAAAVARAVGG